MKNIKFKIQKLINIIHLHNYQYYILNNPLINDEEYDLLLEKLKFLLNIFYKTYKIEYKNKICTHISKNFIYEGEHFPIRYHFPMLSINTIFNKKRFLTFYKNIKKKDINNKKIQFCCELKIDGVGINLIYKKKRLIFAGTRGNGYYGENITKNIFLIPNIPKYLVFNFNNQDLYNPDYCEIRGEIVIPKKDFIFLKKNSEQFNIQHLIYNARNLASGLLLNKVEEISYKKILPHQFMKFYAYNLLFDEHKEKRLTSLLNNQWKRLKILDLLNFKVCKYCFLSNKPEEILFYYKVIKDKAQKLSLDIDGIVIKVNDLKLQKDLGRDNKYPKWAIAIKFPPNNHICYLRNLYFNMSRLGVITPIAIISPINIEGTTISQINIKNFKNINQLDLRLNDAIMIYRAGEVIPQINYVIKTLRLISYTNIKPFNIPSHCKFCNCLIREDEESNIYCTGNIFFCKEQLKYTIKHFISKYAFNIKYMGENIISLLIKKRYLSSPVDIFFLNENNLLELTNLGARVVKKIIEKINLAKIINFKNFIYSLGIPNLGLSIAKKIALGFKRLDVLFKSNEERFKNITSLGSKISNKIFNYIKQKDIRDLVFSLINVYKIKLI